MSDNILEDKRLYLWIGKFGFPEIDTKRTKLLFIPTTSTYYVANGDMTTEKMEIRKFEYKSHKRHIAARMAYSQKHDLLLFCMSNKIMEARDYETIRQTRFLA